MEIAVGNRVVIVFMLKSGSCGFGRVVGIIKCSRPSAKNPIVSVFNPQHLSRIIVITVAAMITTKLPGIFLINFDQIKIKARQIAEIAKEYQFTEVADFT